MLTTIASQDEQTGPVSPIGANDLCFFGAIGVIRSLSDSGCGTAVPGDRRSLRAIGLDGTGGAQDSPAVSSGEVNVTSYRRIIVAWMVASILHVPLPVCDGDNLTSGQSADGHALPVSLWLDFDFVLLGCNPPDDCDDGPLDDDPEDGSHSPFGHAFTLPKPPSQSLEAEGQSKLNFSCSGLTNLHFEQSAAARLRDWMSDGGLRELSSDALCGSDAGHLRC